jgi:hypothetical protein
MLLTKLHHYVGYSQQVLMATGHHCWHSLSETIKTNNFQFSCFFHGRILFGLLCSPGNLYFYLNTEVYYSKTFSYGLCTFYIFHLCSYNEYHPPSTQRSNQTSLIFTKMSHTLNQNKTYIIGPFWDINIYVNIFKLVYNWQNYIIINIHNQLHQKTSSNTLLSWIQGNWI